MARGKIQIKRIENTTNRQVTYSKRRSGLFKKAQELTVLCDAKVSIIMFSSTGRLHEYVSPTATTKQLLDDYQKAAKIDLWSSHYEKMQENLKGMKEVNKRLKTEILQRVGERLESLSLQELYDLEEDMEKSVKLVRDRKLKIISNQTETARKKVKNAEEVHRRLRHEWEAITRGEDSHSGLVDNYESMIDGIFALRLQTNLHNGGRSDLTSYNLLE